MCDTDCGVNEALGVKKVMSCSPQKPFQSDKGHNAIRKTFVTFSLHVYGRFCKKKRKRKRDKK